jgi:hypothetical protein
MKRESGDWRRVASHKILFFNKPIKFAVPPDKSRSGVIHIVTRLGDGWSGVWIPVLVTNLSLLQNRHALEPTNPPIQWVWNEVPLGYSGWEVRVTTVVHIMPRLRISWATSPLLHTPVYHVRVKYILLPKQEVSREVQELWDFMANSVARIWWTMWDDRRSFRRDNLPLGFSFCHIFVY